MDSWYNSMSCFAYEQAGARDYTIGYCMGNILIQIFSIVLTVQAILLLVWRLQAEGWGNLSTYANSQTCLLILVIFFEFLVAVRYTFNLYSLYIYMYLLTLGLCLQFFIFYLVLYVFTRKASELLDNQARTIFFLNLIGVFCFLFAFAIFGVEINFQNKGNKEACNSYIFMLSEFVILILSGIFIYIGWEITRNLKKVMENMAARGQETTSMLTAQRNMWAIIICFSLINLYCFLYSCVQKFGFGIYCHSDNIYVYNTNTILNRLITYNIWVVPII